VGGQRHAPAALPPGKRPCTYFTGKGVGPTAGLDGRRISRPHPDSIPGPSSPQRVVQQAYLLNTAHYITNTAHTKTKQ